MSVAVRPAAPAHPPASFETFGASLRIFDEIPAELGVIAVAKRDACPLLPLGEVAVYDPEAVQHDGGLIDGGIYVYQSQRPFGGTWENFYRFQERHVHVDRWLVRLRMHPSVPGRWCLQRPYLPAWPTSKPASLDQMDDYNLYAQLIGRVVGVFRPNIGHGGH